MQKPQDLNRFCLNAIDRKIRGADYYQLPRPCYPPRPAKLGVVEQHRNLTINLITLLHGGHRIVTGDKIDDLIEVQQGLGQPLKFHGGDCPYCLSSALRLLAQ